MAKSKKVTKQETITPIASESPAPTPEPKKKKKKAKKAKKSQKKKLPETEQVVAPEPMEEEVQEEEVEKEEEKPKLTLKVLDAISDDESDDINETFMVPADNSDEEEEWNKEALALRQAIDEGAFDHIGKLDKSVKTDEKADEKTDEKTDDEEDSKEDSKEELSDSEAIPTAAPRFPSKGNVVALNSKASELETVKSKLPWMERLHITSTVTLPFGGKGEGSPLDIHDDLKREVAFYNVALDAVHKARTEFKTLNVPFTRPDDFFAEMVKTDDHMAKVKDRLIFETKKMDAFEQRKTNKEQKLRSKEARSKKLAQKAQLKKDHFKDVDDWAKSAAANRPQGGMVRDDDDDQFNGRVGSGPNKKRMTADKKYGFGGKTGRFKQMDKKMLNDMSKFNVRGNFGGLGTRTTNKTGAGANRKGKRARDANRK